MNSFSTSFSTSLLPDAEAAEDAVQKVVRVDRADHLAKVLQRAAESQGEEFRRLFKQRVVVGQLQFLQARVHMVAAATLARCQWRPHQRDRRLRQRGTHRIDSVRPHSG